jgi:hypothetical protein
MLRFISQPLTAASSINPRVPAALDSVLSRALEPTPERRFQSALDFVEALEAIVEPASREEVARYVEGVAWSSIHEQKLLLQNPDDREPARLAVSQLWDREEPVAVAASGPRASLAPPDDPTLSRGYFVDPNVSELKSAWKTREADEPTKVDGVRPPPPPPALLTAASDAPELPLYLSPPPTPRISIPRVPKLPSDPEIPAFRGNPERLTRLLWVALGLGAIAFVAALARTPYAQELTRRWASPAATSTPASQAPVSRVAPPLAATPAPSSVAPSPTPSLRVLTLDELPMAAEPTTAEPSAHEETPKRKRGRKLR